MNTLVKGIEIYNKRMETTINDFNKLQKNEMQNEIEKSILNNEIFVKFCKYEYFNTNNPI